MKNISNSSRPSHKYEGIQVTNKEFNYAKPPQPKIPLKVIPDDDEFDFDEEEAANILGLQDSEQIKQKLLFASSLI